jgi:uncharacterized protein
MFGLKAHNVEEIKSIIGQFSEVKVAKIFGSRAKGNYKNGSDVDIALYGENMSNEIALKISGILNEDTIMPYHFDILSYNNLKNTDLVSHIDKVGQILYEA